jgi:hypothetical protein
MHLAKRMTAALVAMMLTASVAMAQSVSVTVNGQPATLNPTPVERAGRVFVPLRGVFERLGASVVYQNGLINAQGNGRSVSLHIGSTQATVNGQPQALDVAPFIIGASTYVPLRFVAQALGAQVNWDNTNRIVAIVNGAAVPNQSIPAQAAAPQAPARSSLSLQRERPANGRSVAAVRPTIEATFANGTADPNSVHMRVDGADVTADTTRSPNGVVYSPPSDLLSQTHHVVVLGKDTNGRPFRLAWSFTSGTAQTSNYIRDLTPANGQSVRPTFDVSGMTIPNSTVEIDAGASVAVGPIAFGGDHERIQAVADSNGRFRQQVQLNAAPGQTVTVVVTSTAPQTDSSVRMTRRFTVS